ncbi:helix-turn-helix domain-containing protein [Streptomyces spiramenti]|uniref:Cupin domain-containing protein n=1 Tax=Streptomyces spiramenti TaxID=2720606 RepID=A0ABX1AMB2_9ACTN|nr:helix-turn-helix transcriptional regulator [Streptomyces spiramenti]NJP67171.1 cupin domain-containing protein [Streptomyces spiramenti]
MNTSARRTDDPPPGGTGTSQSTEPPVGSGTRQTPGGSQGPYGRDDRDDGGIGRVLAGVGPRLRQLREEREVTLATLAEATGISVSTLSRLESGGRRATLELLLPIARAHRVALDDLVGAPETGDPRVRLRPRKMGPHTFMPLTRQPGAPQAYKMIIAGGREENPEQRTHEGYDWIYVLAGRLRLLLGERELVLSAGEVAEFDTRLPHWFGSADDHPVELLGLFGRQGERMHVRARPAQD